ncbi:hypothetical protein [Flavobacterium sp. I3-2]|uniref:hypothetical protein n=1 Tax=Flavobacterium sp. I3-2 TaxID=2748319 RepID=UPI0015B11E10|nr:hypothetical protein [Flavobacterium sp. I3-2]
MRKSICLIIFICLCKLGYSQVTDVQKLIVQDSIIPIPVIVDASYKGGINNFYNYVSTNFNYNNLKKTDVTDEFKNRDIMTIYVEFSINEEGRPVDFKPVNTTAENTFYKETIRVIGSTKWKPATKDGIVFKQEFRIPIQAYIRDFIE